MPGCLTDYILIPSGYQLIRRIPPKGPTFDFFSRFSFEVQNLKEFRFSLSPEIQKIQIILLDQRLKIFRFSLKSGVNKKFRLSLV